MTNYIDRLKKYWKTDSLSFIATFSKYKIKEGFFNDFINPLSLKKLFYPESDDIEMTQNRVSFYVPNASNLMDGHYYKVDLDYSAKASKKNNPYSLEITSISPLNQKDVENHLARSTNEDLLKSVFKIKSILEKDDAKEHIRHRFERLNNPEANKIIANLMREIGKGMYSSKQRMIFELLQNADDAPGKEKVEFHIDTNGDYFFVMHDGAPFSKDDVDAITSAAESTKRKDKKKTGYKGIGFKSVFTDSSEVWLKSGGYQFAFILNSHLFQDFDSFYFSSSDYKEFPQLIERHRKKYQKDILAYNSLTDIPWQVIPIWQEELPSAFNDSNFSNFDNPVQFALKVGSTNIFSEDGYLNAIGNIVKRPQFLLFLRNTSKFRSPKNKVTVTRIDDGQKIKIEKSTVEYIENKAIQHQISLEYLKQIYSGIQVNNDAFIELNIGIKRIVEKNDLNEDTFHFVDLEGNKIETIPPKLASAIETQIAFGILLVDNKIAPEEEYIDGLPKYSSLFTYLPMEDTRFQLPFLLNADFVPSSDRQRIQGDNLWNKYIMIKVAEKHVETLAFFAEQYLTDTLTYGSYLSILLKNPLPPDDTAQHIIDSYNSKYLEDLSVTKIIVNDNNGIQLLSDTIIDNSGLTKLFGHDIFYKIIETTKLLPHAALDHKYLKEYDYLEVESIELEQLAESITPEICELIGNEIAALELFNNSELLKWLNKLVKFIPDHFGKIPFIVHNNSLYSLERILEESDAWLINENTKGFENLFQDLKYHTVNLDLDKYSNIKEYLHSYNGYLNDKSLAYDRIAANPKLPELGITSKTSLIDFLQNSKFMQGIGEAKYFGELELFVDESGKARPLKNILSRKDELSIDSIKKFRLDQTEFENIPEALRKVLISKNEIFTSFMLHEELFQEWSKSYKSDNINVYVSDLKTIYSWVINTDEISSASWASIPWLYLESEQKFVTADKVYWSNAFQALPNEKYNSIRSIILNAELKLLPTQACGELISVFKLKTDDSSNINWSLVKNLELFSANILLDWMEDDGSFSGFFDEYTLTLNDDGLYDIEEISNVHIYDSTNTELSQYIEYSESLVSLFVQLNKNLCSDNRFKIGLLQGDKLLKAVINSGRYDQTFAIHLPANLPFDLLQSFIANLPQLSLKTDAEYGSNTPEHFVLIKLLLCVENLNEIPIEVNQIIENLRSKITINDNPLSNYNVSDRVTFGIKEDKKVLRLSDILEEFQGDSDELEKVKKSFIAITQKEKLRKLIFKTRQLKPDDIYSKIEQENSQYYSVHQVIFQILDNIHGANRQWSKNHFDDYLKNNGQDSQLINSYLEFFDSIIEINLTDLKDFEFHDFDLNKCVEKSYSIDSELIPNWLEEWANNDQDKRFQFLSHLGFNGPDSAIVKFRKSMISKNYDHDAVIRYFDESKPNMQIIWNSIAWLSNYNPEIITRNIAVIQRVNNYTEIDADSIHEIAIPVLSAISPEGLRKYLLQPIPAGSALLKLSLDADHSNDIFNALKTEYSIIVDDSLGSLDVHFSAKQIELQNCIDFNLLSDKSKLWDEAFYMKWEFFNDYPIFIYDGAEIPYYREFESIRINEFTHDLKDSYEGSYYVSKVLKSDILNNLPSDFPEDKLDHLRNWHYKTLQNESLLDDDSFDYKENIDRLLQDRLGISEEEQKRESGNAKTHAVYFLDENGFDVSQAINAGTSLTNILDPDGNQVSCIVRSAKGGLLYLDKGHWDMLQDADNYLIVIYPGNIPRLFKSGLELLEEELAENVLFRVPNHKHINEIDGVFNALESESHLILVTSEKMKESLFSKLKQQKGNTKESNTAKAGDDFKF